MKKKIRYTLMILTASVIVIAAGCPGAGAGGDGGSGDDSAALGTVDITFDETRSGYVLLNSGGGYTPYSTDDGSSYTHTYTVYAGDGAFGQSERTFLSFNFAVPQDMQEVVSASLFVYIDNHANDPYAALGGELNVYGVDYGDLDGNDYYTALGEGNFVLSTSTSVEDSWVSVDVTEAVTNDWNNGKSRTQFMIRFPDANDGDSTPERVFMDGDDTGTDPPYLTVEYR